MTLLPLDRSTSKLSVLAVSASVSAVSLASRYSTVGLAMLLPAKSVAPASFVVGVTVMRDTAFPTEAV